ncbi:MAG: hypothetical protein WDN69_12130 [Aliidongia sp.]
MVDTLPKEFFTLQSMMTLTGATGTVYVVCNTIQQVFDRNPRWLALVVAECIAAAASISPAARDSTGLSALSTGV